MPELEGAMHMMHRANSGHAGDSLGCTVFRPAVHCHNKDIFILSMNNAVCYFGPVRIGYFDIRELESLSKLFHVSMGILQRIKIQVLEFYWVSE